MVRNDEFLKKGLSFLPEVKKTTVHPASVDFSQKSLKEGDFMDIDFGRHVTGYVTFRFGYKNSHPDAPVWLRISFAERKKEFDEKAEEYNGWICKGWVQQEQVHVDVIPGIFSLQRRYAFRYIRVEVLAISSKFLLTIDDVSADAVSSADKDDLIPFSSSDKELQALDTIAVNTIHECMQHVFEDGPKRDRRMWMGDLRLEALTNYVTYHNTDMVKGCLYLFAALTRENGAVSSNIFMEPEPESDDAVMFDYSLLFVAALYEYYKETGDTYTLKELWSVALKQIDLSSERIHDGVVSDDDRIGWCFLDWNLNLNKQAGANGVLLYALLSAISIASVIDDASEEKRLKKLYSDLKEKAFLRFYDEKKGLFTSGKEKQISYASQIWMILGGAVSPERGRDILSRVENDKNAVKMVTPYIYHYYIEALCQCSKKEKALSVLKKYWGGMAAQGADTFWELYDPSDPDASPYGGTIVNSYCHAWSTAPAYFLRKWNKERKFKVKAVIFDLDGVICSTDRYHYKAWKRMADRIGVYFDEKINERLRGVSRIDSLNIILEKSGRKYSDEEKTALAEEKNGYYVEYLSNMSPADLSDDVRKTLNGLRKKGLRLAIGSSSKNTKKILSQIGLSDFFDAVSDGTNITKSKPDPEVFLKAAEMLSLPPAECLVVEDAKAGIEAACRGGFKSAGIGDATKADGVTYPIEKLSDLTGII